jgi:hypothetical protein
MLTFSPIDSLANVNFPPSIPASFTHTEPPMYTMMKFFVCLSIVLLGCHSQHCSAQTSDKSISYWSQFRGIDGKASTAANTPTTWSEDNFAWKVELPGRGWSSPVYMDDEVWLTAATEEAASKEEIAEKLEGVAFARIKTAARTVELFAICVDLNSGKIKHKVELGKVGDPQPINPMNSYASPTCAIADGKVICHFGAHGTWCLNRGDGSIEWTREFVINHSVGPGSSPVISGDKVILVCDGCDKQYVAAVKLSNGETVWQTDRPPIKEKNGEFRKSYSSPLLIDLDGVTQAVVPGAQWICSYNVEDGSEIWRADYGRGYSLTAMAVYSAGLFTFSTAYDNMEFVAVSPGKGDVTESIKWRGRNAPSMSSFVEDGGKIYAVSDRPGALMCINAETGEVENKKRFISNVSASILKSGGHLYVGNRDGIMKVVRCDLELSEVSSFDFGSPIYATPSVVGDDLLVRTKDFLVRIKN